MNRSQRRVWALAWLGATALASFILSLRYLEWRYQILITDEQFRFERPWAGLLLLGAALVWFARIWVQRLAKPRLQFSRGAALLVLRTSWRGRLGDLPNALRTLALALLVIGLMGPQSIHARDTAEIDGIEIMLTLDMSRSMEAADIRPTRFKATKSVVRDFIDRRPNDRIGAVVFGLEAYTLLPLTTDREALGTALRGLELDQIDGRGTAIGNAVGVSLNRLKRSRAKSKVLILLTDGESNAGNISPSQAAALATAMDVKIFPILMGVTDQAPVQKGIGIFGRALWRQGNYPVNPELLEEMAAKTGGEFFAVSDREGLERSFHQILDALEKTEIEDAGRMYTELFPAFVGPALLFLLIE
ncbi:MAG: VWA domain-containing protein, partial [Deltaproteobacteria bacterium]|nr:VWA domain-containing protein [Deltaproteobacteria bacterium]